MRCRFPHEGLAVSQANSVVVTWSASEQPSARPISTTAHSILPPGARNARCVGAGRVGVLPRRHSCTIRRQCGVHRQDRYGHGLRTPRDVQAFVQCAHEFVQEVGVAEAQRALEKDERWRSGPTYAFVRERIPSGSEALLIVFPPDPAAQAPPGKWRMPSEPTPTLNAIASCPSSARDGPTARSRTRRPAGTFPRCPRPKASPGTADPRWQGRAPTYLTSRVLAARMRQAQLA